MNADMKRLCEAALAKLPLYDPRDFGGMPSRLDAAEAIVRAVLAGLRDPGSSGEWPNFTAGEWDRRNVEAFVDDMLRD